jgi:hypothetical protein
MDPFSLAYVEARRLELELSLSRRGHPVPRRPRRRFRALHRPAS